MKMIIYEIKKVTMNKFFLVSTALLLAYFFWFSITGMRNMVDFYQPEASAKVYSEINSGKTNADKLYEYEQSIILEVIKAENRENLPAGIYGKTIETDFLAVSKARDQLRYVESSYKTDMLKMIRSLYSRYLQAQRNGNKYLEKYYNKAISKYNVEYDIKPMDSASGYSFLELFHFNWESRVFSILFIMWAAFVTVYCLQSEKVNHCYEMVYSTSSGREKTFLRKTAALSMIFISIAVLFAVIELILGIAAFKIKEFSAPIQSLKNFEYCTFGVSYIGFFLLINLMRLLSVIFTMGIAMLCTIRARSLTRPLAVIFTLLGSLCYLMVVLTGLHGIKVEEYWAKVRTFFPLSLSQPLMYFTKFDYENIFGMPINRLLICIFLFVIFIGVCIFVTAKSYGKAGNHNG